MKRKLAIVGIFVLLAVAMALVIALSQQSAETTSNRTGFALTTNNQLVVQPRDGYGVPTVIAHLPKTNNVAGGPAK